MRRTDGRDHILLEGGNFKGLRIENAQSAGVDGEWPKILLLNGRKEPTAYTTQIETRKVAD